jgi:hypothetical protein
MKVTALRAWSILTLAMPSVKTEQIQNLVLFWDFCKKPKSVVSGNLSKMAMFEQLDDQLLLNSK